MIPKQLNLVTVYQFYIFSVDSTRYILNYRKPINPTPTQLFVGLAPGIDYFWKHCVKQTVKTAVSSNTNPAHLFFKQHPYITIRLARISKCLQDMQFSFSEIYRFDHTYLYAAESMLMISQPLDFYIDLKNMLTVNIPIRVSGGGRR